MANFYAAYSGIYQHPHEGLTAECDNLLPRVLNWLNDIPTVDE